jgi:ATP-dependent DNA helicase RecG
MMMSLQKQVDQVLPRLRAAQTDLADVEIKRAEGGAPKSLPETISAFSNGSGGLIILGLDEKHGFTPVPIDPTSLADAVAGYCQNAVEPAVRADVDTVLAEGQPIVAAVIPAGDRLRLPYFVKNQGLERGSYVRGHDGDRHLTSYEIHTLIAQLGQPRDDLAVVPGATLADLNPDLVKALVRRLRDTRGAVFGNASDTDVLRFVQVLDRDRDQELVTLAGLLTLGWYPQQFFPQLDITFVSYPTTRAGVQLADGTRFLDNASCDGPIPLMIEQALRATQRNMTRRAVIQGAGREDRLEYPVAVIRELLANAVMHRDYFPLTHGSQIRVEMYPDRLEISSPGGLYGDITPGELLHVPISSSRNSALAKLLEDVTYPGTNQTICENRGTGMLAVSDLMHRAGLPEPEVVTHITTFQVILRNQLTVEKATLLPVDQPVTVANPRQPAADRARQILNLLRDGPKTTPQLAAATGLKPGTIRHRLQALEEAGQVIPTEKNKRSTKNAWQLTPDSPPTC